MPPTTSTNAELPIATASSTRVELPRSLQKQIGEYRTYVRGTKLVEAFLLCVLVGLCAYTIVYFSDRLTNTHWVLLCCLFALAWLIWLLLPVAIYRWVWGSRRWEQVARLLRKRSYGLGDDLLSAIELSESVVEQSRSPKLCLAAMRQVAERASAVDFRTAAPRHRVPELAIAVTLMVILVAIITWRYPEAAANAWLRLIRPWNPAARYTFVSVASVPDKWTVPHGEPSTLSIGLLSNSLRRPPSARLNLGKSTSEASRVIEVELSKAINFDTAAGLLSDGVELPNLQPGSLGYHFPIPPITTTRVARLQVGDYSKEISIEPRMRPELTSLNASVQLPEYLQITDAVQQDARAGVVSVVEGSNVTLTATVSNTLEFAWAGGEKVSVAGSQFKSRGVLVGKDLMELELNWQDNLGLTCRRPFRLQIQSYPDELPSIAAQDLPRQAVILDSEQINFRALAADDFGVKEVGIAWKGLAETLVARPAEGRKVVAGGGPTQPSLQVPATFCAASLGISAQPLEVTVWVQDFSPDHPPVYSAPHILYVLTSDEHAIWITTQISKWHRSALEVRDTELQLFQANQQLQEDFQKNPKEKRLIESLRRQAALEEANGRKLSSLTQAGSELLRQGARNPDVSAESIDQMAKMLEVLKDISGNRMPSVAELLKQAAENSLVAAAASSRDQPATAPNPENSNSVASGQPSPISEGQSKSVNNNSGQGATGELKSSKMPDFFTPPSIADVESSLHSPDALNTAAEARKEQQKPGVGGSGLPQTTLIGPTSPSKDERLEEQQLSPEDLAKQQPLPKAMKEQLELLAEFEKVAEQMNAVLGNLEGSTLVKRLKAASREQGLVAEKIASRIENIFGRSRAIPADDKVVLESLSQSQHKSSQTLSFIMDDMQAYFDRRKIPEIKSVLDEMKNAEVLTSLKKLGDDLLVEHGLSIAQAEYWADTIDRWAEDLVESSDSKSDEAGSESKDSLPPRFVLEMLRILEGEVNLREETRVADKACQVVTAEVHHAESQRLSRVQGELQQRTNTLAHEISALPNAEQNFGQEILLFSKVSQIMEEVKFLLSVSNVGPQTIAAETEIIELLLQSKRVNPQGGGGGGTSPGGGGQGTTDESAMALLGAGLNPKERQEARDVGQGVGKANNRVFPEEFRGGLDAYFEMLESRADKQ